MLLGQGEEVASYFVERLLAQATRVNASSSRMPTNVAPAKAPVSWDELCAEAAEDDPASEAEEPLSTWQQAAASEHEPCIDSGIETSMEHEPCIDSGIETPMEHEPCIDSATETFPVVLETLTNKATIALPKRPAC